MRLKYIAISVAAMWLSGCDQKIEDQPISEATTPTENVDIVLHAVEPLHKETLDHLAATSEGNRFLPRGYLSEVTEKKHKALMVEFNEYYALRKKVQTGRLKTADEARQYYKIHLKILEERLHLLKTLSTDLRNKPTTGATIDKVALSRLVSSTESIEAAQKYTQTAIEKHKILLAKADLSIAIAPQRERVMCVVDDWGFVYCVSEQNLVNWAVSGHWNETSEWIIDGIDFERAYSILEKIDELLDQLGDSQDSNTLVICADGTSLPVNTQGPDPMLAEIIPPTAASLPSVSEMAGMSEACKLLSGGSLSTGSGGGGAGGSGTGSLGGSNSDMVENTIEAIEAMLDRCQDGPGGGMMQSGAGIFEWVNPLSKSNLFYHLVSLPHDEGAMYEEKRQAELAFQEQKHDLDSMHYGALADWRQSEADALDAEADALEAEAGRLRGQAIAATQDENDPDKAAELWAKAAEKSRQAEEKRKEAEKKRKEAEAARKKAEEAARVAECIAKTGKPVCTDEELEAAEEEAEESGTTEDQTASDQIDGEDVSSCDSMRADWNRFKDECERTQSWERPGTDCNAFLRRANGCVDVTLINPGPDGDMTCLRGEIDEETLLQGACSEKGKFMLSLEPGSASCGLLDRSSIPNLVDICRDPAARPMEEQCPGFGPIGFTRPGPVLGGNPPRPYSNVWKQGDIQIVDALRLDGLGGPGAKTTR